MLVMARQLYVRKTEYFIRVPQPLEMEMVESSVKNEWEHNGKTAEPGNFYYFVMKFGITFSLFDSLSEGDLATCHQQ